MQKLQTIKNSWIALFVSFVLALSSGLVVANGVVTAMDQQAYFAQSAGTAEPQGGGLGATPQTDDEIKANPIFKRLQTIVNFLTVGVALVITISVVIAGFQYITSKGDPSKTKAAVDRLWNAGIAVFLYVFMYVIISWLIPGGTLLGP